MIMYKYLMLFFALCLSICACKQQKAPLIIVEKPSPEIVEDMSHFLYGEYIMAVTPVDFSKRKFMFNDYDLNHDGENERLLLELLPFRCDPKGCELSVCNIETFYGFITSSCKPPIGVSKNATNGWQDILVKSGDSYRILKHNGKKYPAQAFMGEEISKSEMEELMIALVIEEGAENEYQMKPDMIR